MVAGERAVLAASNVPKVKLTLRTSCTSSYAFILRRILHNDKLENLTVCIVNWKYY